ncbi:MAG: MFS transporter [Nanoarchaeota archaeon]
MNEKERILLYGSNIWYFGEGMLGPLFAVFAGIIGGNILDITWAWAIYLIVAGVMIMVVGRISDEHISKEKLMILGYVLNTLFTFSYLLVSSPEHLFFVQTGLGIAAALAIPTWTALYAEHEDRKHAGFTWGLASGESSLLTGFAIIIGGLIVNFISFKALFIVMGTVQIIATIVQARILKDYKKKKK